ncbi:UDP-3-O-(3-hydroxymyristoyl) glucosamine N-acyltransferase [Pseudomonas poae]|nr:UDP-3-O-(3-hydroxymyristoyl) glucosamine N-acyltransferase [Pseudomonas poae]
MIDSNLLKLATGLNSYGISVDGAGTADSQFFNTILTFIEDHKYASIINKNEKIKAVFVRLKDQHVLDDRIDKIIVDDPKWYFFTLVNYLSLIKERSASVVSDLARIHSSAVISSQGVIIEDDVIIEAGVVVLDDVLIKRGAVIRAGAVIGVNGFEHKRTSRGMLTVGHDGGVVIGEYAEVGPNCTVVKGFSYRNTIIGRDTKLDGLVHYAHGVQSGERCLIAASAMLAGNVTLGHDVWVGPGSAISNRLSLGDKAFVTIGAVVVRDVAAGEKVTGNFAIPHLKFIKNLMRSLK